MPSTKIPTRSSTSQTAAPLGTGSATIYAEWRLCPSSSCSGYSVVGSRQPTMVANTPYVQGPYGWNLSNVPTGLYYLRVNIDALPGETLTTDNRVTSAQATIRVIQ